MNACLKTFFHYVSLSTIGMIFISAYVLADTFFISSGVGIDGLTALNLILPLYNILNAVGLMIGFGGGSRFNFFLSQRRKEEAKNVFTYSVILASFFSLIFIIAGFFANPIMKLFTQNPHVEELSTIYLSTMFFFAPAFIFNNLFLGFMRNDNAPTLAMLGQIIGSVSNVILDYIFIFPLNMGIFGAILATGLAPLISISIMSIHIFRRKNNFALTKISLSPTEIKNITTNGLPSFIAEISTGIVTLVFNHLIFQELGDIGIASFGVVSNVAIVFIAVFNGISQGVQPLISQSDAEGNKENKVAYFRCALITSLVVSVIIYLATFLLSDFITSIFNSENNETLSEIGSLGIKEYFIALPFVGINLLIATYFAAVSKPFKGQIISLLRGLIIIVPFAFLMANLFSVHGIFLSFPVNECITAIIATILLINEHKHIKNIN